MVAQWVVRVVALSNLCECRQVYYQISLTSACIKNRLSVFSIHACRCCVYAWVASSGWSDNRSDSLPCLTSCPYNLASSISFQSSLDNISPHVLPLTTQRRPLASDAPQLYSISLTQRFRPWHDIITLNTCNILSSDNHLYFHTTEISITRLTRHYIHLHGLESRITLFCFLIMQHHH